MTEVLKVQLYMHHTVYENQYSFYKWR